jgi:hypothetical protein
MMFEDRLQDENRQLSGAPAQAGSTLLVKIDLRSQSVYSPGVSHELTYSLFPAQITRFQRWALS